MQKLGSQNFYYGFGVKIFFIYGENEVLKNC
jgi:hypothetical protein